MRHPPQRVGHVRDAPISIVGKVRLLVPGIAGDDQLAAGIVREGGGMVEGVADVLHQSHRLRGVRGSGVGISRGDVAPFQRVAGLVVKPVVDIGIIDHLAARVGDLGQVVLGIVNHVAGVTFHVLDAGKVGPVRAPGGVHGVAFRIEDAAQAEVGVVFLEDRVACGIGVEGIGTAGIVAVQRRTIQCVGQGAGAVAVEGDLDDALAQAVELLVGAPLRVVCGGKHDLAVGIPEDGQAVGVVGIRPGIAARVGEGGQVAVAVVAEGNLAVGGIVDREQAAVLVIELQVTPAERFADPVEFATGIGVIEAITEFVAPAL